MSNQKQENLISLRKKLQAGGGEKGIQNQHAKGKETARERIEKLLDKDSFVETGLFVKHHCANFGLDKKEIPAEGVVTGYGKINGRLVYISAQDFTVMGGSLGEMHANKIAATQEMALKAGAPMICINDSGGARIQEGVNALGGYGKLFFNNTKASGVIPQISVIMGPCAGGAVYSPALTDFVFMVENTSQMFITGPNVIKAVTGEIVTGEALGGSMTHNKTSGCAHFSAKDEAHCFEQIRQLLSFLPQNNKEAPPSYYGDSNKWQHDQEMNDIIPESASKAYDMKKIIRLLADDDNIFEYQEHFAKNIITAFIRMDGHSVGVIASQPSFRAGCLDIDSSDKAARFVRTCDAYNIPLLTLVDVPGFLPGTQQEYGGIIRHGAKLLFAYSEATVPKVTVITRKAYGGAYIAMCSKHLGGDYVFAWPSAEIAVMGAEGAANIIFGREIRNSENPEEKRKEKIEEYNELMMNPYVAASVGYVDDVILPEETRKRVISAFATFNKESMIDKAKFKKHGNIPL